MKDIRAYSVRDMALLWAGGCALAVCMMVTASIVGWPASASMLNDFARSATAYQSRDRQIVADYEAYARAHPNDAAAQAEAHRHLAAIATSARNDSAISALVHRGVLDTTFHAEDRSPRATFAHLVESIVSLALFWMAVVVPIVLVGATLWWGIARSASRAT